VARIDIPPVQFKVFFRVIGRYQLCCAVLIVLQTAALTPVGPEPVDGYTAGDALLAIFTMRPVCVAAAAPVSEFDELAVQLNIHLHAWIRHKIGCHLVRQVAAFMFAGEVQIKVL
jgi:hypothetical protein